MSKENAAAAAQTVVWITTDTVTAFVSSLGDLCCYCKLQSYSETEHSTVCLSEHLLNHLVILPMKGFCKYVFSAHTTYLKHLNVTGRCETMSLCYGS